VASTVPGRHRAPGRFNPVSELSGIVAKSAQPAVKTSAVIAASGGLVASFALPASAATASQATEKAPSSAPAALKAPAVATPKAADAFGLIGFQATPKPKPVVAPPAPAPVVAPQPQQVSRSMNRVAFVVAKPATGGILGIAAQYQGVPYVYGGTTPSGFDCSGYTAYVFRQAGISLPRTAAEQQAAATPVSNPQPGDLVFFGSPAYHVGIYAGNGMMWDAPHSGESVGLRPVWSSSATYGRP
jgi:cell wall-associated NlpC family hydrolase